MLDGDANSFGRIDILRCADIEAIVAAFAIDRIKRGQCDDAVGVIADVGIV